MYKHLFVLFAGTLPLIVAAQAGETTRESPPAPPPVDVLNGGWDNQVANSRAVQWKEAHREHPNDAGVQLNWLLSERNARAGNNNGRLGPNDQAVLDRIAAGIKANAPGSFEQHMAAYAVEFPAAPAFTELAAAYAIAPERRELEAPMLTRAMLRGDAAGIRQWSGALVANGAIAPSLYAVAKDVLLSMDARGILFTNGDMDTQPVIVQQAYYGDSPGALVVDRRLLEQPAYRKAIWARAGARGPEPGPGAAFAQALLTATDRPVYFGLGLDRTWLDAFPGQLHAVGAVFRVGGTSSDAAAALARNWPAMEKPMDAGPLSRNYLLPGAVLLARLRATGRTAEAHALEGELRRIAAATGGAEELERSGILTR